MSGYISFFHRKRCYGQNKLVCRYLPIDDLMVSPPPTSADVGIVEPVMFAHVHGKVDMIGSAAGDGFVSYRLLVGQGLNPQAWLQIGDDEKNPISNDRLGIWDVDNSSGLYTIQLQVIYRDQRIETFILQVTVDNTPPELMIEYPDDRQITFPANLLDCRRSKMHVASTQVQAHIIESAVIGLVAQELCLEVAVLRVRE